MKTERKFGLGVLILIFNKDYSKILLLKRNEEKRKKNNADWGFVGGRVELGEKITEACAREIREETSIKTNTTDLKLVDIKENPFLTEIHHAVWFIYSANIDENIKITLNDESEESRWFNLDNLPDRMIDSKEEAKILIKKAKEIR
jgi:ADP-ribose pyrophosphatase YjhB (NUDIX family)